MTLLSLSLCVFLQVCLIPESAHGTNAASAQMAGLNVVYIPTDKKTGMVSIEDFKIKVCRRSYEGSEMINISVSHPLCCSDYHVTVM